MQMEESVQHVVMNAIQEVHVQYCSLVVILVHISMLLPHLYKATIKNIFS